MNAIPASAGGNAGLKEADPFIRVIAGYRAIIYGRFPQRPPAGWRLRPLRENMDA